MLSSLSLDDISNIPLQQVGADVATSDVNFHKNPPPPFFPPLSLSLSLFSGNLLVPKIEQSGT